MPDDRSDHEEILRARDRLHRMESSLRAIEWRLRGMEELLPGLKQLLADDRIDAWRRARRRVTLTWSQRIVALVVAAFAAWPTVSGWFG